MPHGEGKQGCGCKTDLCPLKGDAPGLSEEVECYAEAKPGPTEGTPNSRKD
jgi:hypothetical protein